MENIKESHFVNQQELDGLLDKISEYGLESLSTIEKKSLNYSQKMIYK